MADFIHLTNIIQGEVLRIRERRPLEQQPELLLELIDYLNDQTTAVTITRLKVTEELSEG
jgi:hypothetical protein